MLIHPIVSNHRPSFAAPGNGVGMKIWQCYDNLPAQQWHYTDDNRIALENQGQDVILSMYCLLFISAMLTICSRQGQCLDLTNGMLTNGNQVQTWQCTDFSTNQIWTT